jgi:hypothetical protein
MNQENQGGASSTRPLTFGQRTRLLIDCVPFIGLAAMVAGFHFFWVPIAGAPNPVFYLFLFLVLAVTGYETVGRLRDLRSGVALVGEDVLVRAGRSRRPGGGAFWARFSQLGRMRLTPSAFSRSANGVRHRIVYSPASRLVWSVEPLHDYERAH